MFQILITFWILSNFSWKFCEDTTFWSQENCTPKFLTVVHHSKPKGFSTEFFIVPIHMALQKWSLLLYNITQHSSQPPACDKALFSNYKSGSERNLQVLDFPETWCHRPKRLRVEILTPCLHPFLVRFNILQRHLEVTWTSKSPSYQGLRTPLSW